ncbi:MULTISPECIES: DUF2187 domain-containing protein [Lacticaseibacillus]|uniref:DUF2187 domain-containing protein n=2 Tax=Lacticaseibacillus TaxID=2759736 RepID=A0ABW4CLN0_9LACO|nr:MULTISPECIES: DUF2187 domain-containing protein [Lacticaseibacillus]
MEVTKGAIVQCKPNGNMEHPFTGKVEKVYENSAFVSIIEYDDEDTMNARELLFRAVIAKKKMKVLKAGEPMPLPAIDEVG